MVDHVVGTQIAQQCPMPRRRDRDHVRAFSFAIWTAQGPTPTAAPLTSTRWPASGTGRWGPGWSGLGPSWPTSTRNCQAVSSDTGAPAGYAAGTLTYCP